jgi:hypothetical protein
MKLPLLGGYWRTVYRPEPSPQRRNQPSKGQGVREGYPSSLVLVSRELLASVEPTTGVHIVTIPSAGMVLLLPNALRPPRPHSWRGRVDPGGRERYKKLILSKNTYSGSSELERQAIRRWVTRLDRVVEGDPRSRWRPFGGINSSIPLD